MRIRKGIPVADDPRASEGERDDSRTVPRADDAEFLVEQFDVAPHEADDLVAGGDATPARETASAKRKRRDLDADHPPPRGDDRDIVPDNDEVREKPVLRQPNRRTGAG